MNAFFQLTAQTHFQPSHGCACSRPFSKIKDTYADRHNLPAHPKRGGVNSACGITISTFRLQVTAFARAGKVLLIAQAGLHKDPCYSDLPNMLDEAKSPEAKQMMRVPLAPLEPGRPIAPPSTPAHRAALLRMAMTDTLGHLGFRALAKKLRIDV